MEGKSKRVSGPRGGGGGHVERQKGEMEREKHREQGWCRDEPGRDGRAETERDQGQEGQQRREGRGAQPRGPPEPLSRLPRQGGPQFSEALRARFSALQDRLLFARQPGAVPAARGAQVEPALPARWAVGGFQSDPFQGPLEAESGFC